MLEKYSLTVSESSGRVTSSFVQSLIRYFSGRSSRSKVMQELGIDHYGVLLQRLNLVGLPRPNLPDQVRQKMADDLMKVLSEHDKGA